jgi:phosphoribosylformylglycinamidine synthase
MELCPQLGIAIPVGKDSMSMKTAWRDPASGEDKSVTAPLSLVISAFAPVTDVRGSLTPELRRDLGETELILIDLGGGRNRLGASALAQVFGEIGHEAPDLDHPARLKGFFDAIQKLNAADRILAYHDRSDGGLFATVCEMAFASRGGVSLYLDALAMDQAGLDVDGHERQTDVLAGNLQERVLGILFSEELGAVIQVRKDDRATVMHALREAGLSRDTHVIGHPNKDSRVRVIVNASYPAPARQPGVRRPGI